MPDVPRDRSSPSPSGAKHLALTYQGRPYTVEKERFLLGRSKTQADLRLDDPNVSRQHAVIERVGAAWYIVDLGSTNGVHVAGERVARRALSDGDIIVITSHEIRCTLR
jgi:predicted component of type VI protein secretion system